MNPPTGKPARKWGDLGLRSLVAVILIPLVLLITWAGGIWFEALVAALGVLIAFEWAAMVHAGDRVQKWLHAGTAMLIAIAAHHKAFLLLAAILIIGWVASLVLARRGNTAMDLWRIAGIPYVSLPVAALILLRGDSQLGLAAIFWIFALVWLADTLAYFAGKSIGGPKLAPTVSPNKTWAGFGGAVAGGILGSLLVSAVFGLSGLFVLALLGAVFAVVEQLGDLFESAVKRKFGIKDSGAIIPGHGGVLDRVDGLIAVAVLAVAFGGLRWSFDEPAIGLLAW